MALAERVEAGSGSDRELDAAIAQAVLGLTHDGRPEPYRRWMRKDPDGAIMYGSDVVMIRRFTDSLDAAVALVERALPDARWSVSTNEGEGLGETYATVYEPDRVSIAGMSGMPEYMPARALLAATLRALAASPKVREDMT